MIRTLVWLLFLGGLVGGLYSWRVGQLRTEIAAMKQELVYLEAQRAQLAPMLPVFYQRLERMRPETQERY